MSLKWVCILILFLSCDIETDVVRNSPDVLRTLEVSINEVSQNQFAIMKDGTQKLDVIYKENGNSPNAEINPMWESLNTGIVNVSEDGVITGVSSGQVSVVARFNNAEASILITVVMTNEAVAKVEISEPLKTLYESGETVQLSTKVYNIQNVELRGKTIFWSSSNESVASVNSEGLVSFLMDGSVQITATVESIESNPINFSVMDAATMLSGSFVNIGNHSVSGSAVLSQSGSDLILTLNSNFVSQSGPDLYITLANNASSYSNSDYEVASIAGNLSGMRSYTIPNKLITDFKYVHVWCKPFNVVFGSAELN